MYYLRTVSRSWLIPWQIARVPIQLQQWEAMFTIYLVAEVVQSGCMYVVVERGRDSDVGGLGSVWKIEESREGG